ncbi:MAG: glycosyltransferase [Gemmatimonadota bacterium]|nr:MAG: glycosyltransferase [Gemmatimonadota bacterium]
MISSRQAAHFLLTPIGSAGDVHPFVAIGRELRARGHDVTILVPGPFRQLAERSGLDFVSTFSVADFESQTRHPDLWHPRRGLRLILRTVASLLRRTYELISKHYQPGRTVLVGHTLAFATRVFEEVHEVPAATIHLAPSALRSDHQQPAFALGVDISTAPRPLKRSFWKLVDALVIDPHITPTLNAWRTELGLPPVRRVFRSWLNSPQRVIGLFPDWYFPTQPDWPNQLRLVGFPLFDDSAERPIEPELDAFLAQPDPPILFTPGSANRQAARFFEVAVSAAARLGRRALLVTPFREQLPERLPEHARHVSYVPFSAVLRRCAAIVHHGGIGTSAQGLAAGIPQLVMAMGFDQPDNAMRLARLGVGVYLSPRRFRTRRVADTLHDLLESRETAANCRRYREAAASVDAVGAASDVLEDLSTMRE